MHWARRTHFPIFLRVLDRYILACLAPAGFRPEVDSWPKTDMPPTVRFLQII